MVGISALYKVMKKYKGIVLENELSGRLVGARHKSLKV